MVITRAGFYRDPGAGGERKIRGKVSHINWGSAKMATTLESRSGWEGGVMGANYFPHLYFVAHKSTVQGSSGGVFIRINEQN